MPQLITKHVASNRIVKDDIIDGMAVEMIEVKQKYVYVHFADVGTVRRIALDHTVEVSRSAPTPEEDEASRIEFSLRAIRVKIDNAPIEVEKARAALLKNLEVGVELGSTPYHAYDYGVYLEAQAVARQWSKVVMIAERREIDLIEATRQVAEELREKLLSMRPGDCRSTSVLHNATGDVVHAAALKWLRDLVWVLL